MFQGNIIVIVIMITFGVIVIVILFSLCVIVIAIEYVASSGVRRKFSWGGFIQWHRVVICICCALFVTSQFDVIVLFPNKGFSEVL